MVHLATGFQGGPHGLSSLSDPSKLARSKTRISKPSVSKKALSLAPSAIALLGLALLVAAQFGAAIWHGGVSAQSQLILGGLVLSGAVAIWVFGFALGARTPSAPLLVWILLVAIGLGAIQAWPGPWSKILGSQQLALKQQLSDDSLEAVPPRWAPSPSISLHPYATRRDTAALAVLTLALLAASVGIRTKWGPLVVLLGPALLGGGLAIYGLTLQISGDPAVVANRPLLATSFATFVNPNHAGGYFNLCVGASLGIAWWAFANKAENLKLSSAKTTRDRWQRLQMRVRWEIATLNARKFAAIALVSLSAAAAICTLSRGAIVALIGGSIFTVLIVLLGRRSIAGVLAGILVLATGIGLTAWVGMTEQVSAELATLAEKDAASSRMNLWSSVLPIAFRYGLFGTGLGTFRYVYRPELDGVDRVWFYHAENQYVEALIDGGWIGLALILVALMIAIWQIWRLVRCTGSRRYLAVGVAAMFGLITQAIQATCDFGLYLPSNHWLLAILVGSAIGARTAHRNLESEAKVRAAAKDKEGEGKETRPRRLLPVSTAAIAMWVITISSVSWGLVDHYRATRLELALAASEVDFDSESVGAERLATMIDTLRISCVETGSAEGWLRLSQLYQARFREQWLDLTLPAEATEEDRTTAWPLVSLAEFHRRAAIAHRTDPEHGLEALFVSVGGRHALVQADDALRRARRASPVIASVHMQLAETCVASEDLEEDARHLGRALSLAPNKPDFFALAGLLDLHCDRLESCQTRWRRALELDPAGQVGLVTRLALEVMPVYDVATRVVPSNAMIQLDLAKRMRVDEIRSRELKEKLLQLALAALSDTRRTPEDSIVLARIQRELGSLDASRASYEEALLAQPYEKQWRLEFVEILVAKQDWERAQTEIDRVLMLDNDWAPALRLRDTIRTALIRVEASLPLD